MVTSHNISIPSKAVIPDKVHIVCDRRLVKPGGSVRVRLASIYQKNKPNNIIFTVPNLFHGPFQLCNIKSTGNSFGALLKARHIFPFKEHTVEATCWLPNWSLNGLVMSGVIGKNGHIGSNVKMCAVTYGGHNTLVSLSSDLYNEIPKKP